MFKSLEKAEKFQPKKYLKRFQPNLLVLDILKYLANFLRIVKNKTKERKLNNNNNRNETKQQKKNPKIKR